MGNTVFYKDVKRNPNKITLKEIMSECTKKHSKRDFEYQLSAGTVFNKSTENDMLQKWQKPWMFYRMFIISLSLLALIFGAYMISKSRDVGPDVGTLVFSIVVPPFLIPIAVTTFLWELNIPRNITIYEVVLAFLFGGVGSLFSNYLIRLVGSEKLQENAAYAGLFEEPAKLIPAIIILIIIFKDKKMYGLSGIVIGAAVGAGFCAFESTWYVINYTVFNYVEGLFLETPKFFFESRFLGGFAGHITRAACITGAVTLHTNKNKISLESFLNFDFIFMFVATITTHYINNSTEIKQAIGVYDDNGNENEALGYLLKIGIIIVEWLVLLYLLRKCLYQVVSIGRYKSGESIGYTEAIGNLGRVSGANAQMAAANAVKITVVGMSGALKGAVWQSTGNDKLTIGRDENNVFHFPLGVAGISRQHCVIKFAANGWVITDLNSSYGTSVNGVKVQPGIEQPLREGDVICLGGAEQTFKISFRS